MLGSSRVLFAAQRSIVSGPELRGHPDGFGGMGRYTQADRRGIVQSHTLILGLPPSPGSDTSATLPQSQTIFMWPCRFIKPRDNGAPAGLDIEARVSRLLAVLRWVLLVAWRDFEDDRLPFGEPSFALIPAELSYGAAGVLPRLATILL
jgi:hypothetical protein